MMHTLKQDLVVTAFGAVSCALTGILLVLFEEYTGFAFYTWLLWFFIPIGAIVSGFIAATGYYFGARLFGHRPGILVLINMISISIGTFFLIYYFSYAFFMIEGISIKEHISFWTYLDIAIRSSSLEFRTGARVVDSSGELGAWGYIHALLQICGFALGGGTAYHFLTQLPYCEKCSKYLYTRDQQIRVISDVDQLKELVAKISEAYALDQPQMAIDLHSASGDPHRSEDSLFEARMHLKHCRKCNQHWLGFTVNKRTGNEWEEIHELELSCYYDGELSLASKPGDST